MLVPYLLRYSHGQAGTQLIYETFRLLFMTKVTKYISQSFLTMFIVGLTGFIAKADVHYSAPLSGAEYQIGNLLVWSTAFEKNSQTFVIEKSTDGINFTKTGLIDAAGYSHESKNYRFLDIGVDDKQLIYRLKQVDEDGTASYSQSILITKEMSNKFMVVAMTNVVTETSFDLTIDALEQVKLEYSVKNKEGELISNDQQLLYEGLNDIMIDLGDEKEGIYIITLRSDHEVEQLVIQKINDPSKKKDNFATKPIRKGKD